MKSHLDIQVGGTDLALMPDASVHFNDQNPLFNDTELFSLPFELPSDGNRSVFRNIDARDSALRPADVENTEAKIIVGGLPYRTSVLHMQEGQEIGKTIPVNLDSRTKSLKDMIQNLKCRDIPVDSDILIGEKIGSIDFHFNYQIKCREVIFGDIDNGESMSYGSWSYTREGSTGSQSSSFTPPALGFSFPGVVSSGTGKTKEYTNPSATVNVPTVSQSFINVSKPYPQAKYCNTRVCYAHHGYDSEKQESTSDILEMSEASYINEDYGSYWVLDADRPASGICFYVGYFLERLFKYLGVDYDITALTNIEDFNYLAFITTACKYDEVAATEYGTLASVDDINAWLTTRGCGGQVSFDDKEASTPTAVTSFTDNTGTTYREGETWEEGTLRRRVDSLQRYVEVSSYSATATISRMYANSENFPNAEVSQVISSLENSFGVRFFYDQEVNKVTCYLLRDIFRATKSPIHLNGTVLSMTKMVEKTVGVRMKYSAESDKEEQRDNVRYGKRDYDTDYDYVDYPENRTVMKAYKDVVAKIDVADMNVYVNSATGNAIRIKIDKEATTIKDMKPTAFEVGAFKGIEVGDCSDEAEDNEGVIELVSDFQPLVVNDVNFRNGGTTKENYQPVLVPYMDVDMEHEFVESKIQNPFTIEGSEVYLTYLLKLVESYDPSSTDDGQSPLMDYDWGLTIGILRTGDGGAGLENYDPNYDGFGNWRWRDIADNYCMSSDTMDQTGLWLGKTDQANTFSLKIRAWKPFVYYYDRGGKIHMSYDTSLAGKRTYHNQDAQNDFVWLIPCDDDVRDETGHITRRLRSRGLADVFMAEYIYFLLHRQKYKVKMLCEAAQLADIPRHWRDRYEIDGKAGWLNVVSYDIDVESGIGEVEIELFAL